MRWLYIGGIHSSQDQDFPNLSISWGIDNARYESFGALFNFRLVHIVYVATSVACDPKPVEQMPVVCTTSSSDVFEGGS
jgi:hypothetical protein